MEYLRYNCYCAYYLAELKLKLTYNSIADDDADVLHSDSHSACVSRHAWERDTKCKRAGCDVIMYVYVKTL